MTAIRIDAWSDIACPWCYIGKRNLEAGLTAFAQETDAPAVEVRYHSFELDPDAPLEFDGSAEDYLAQRKGITPDVARQMHERVTAVAAGAGLRYDFGALKRARTARAHQLIHLAHANGVQEAAVERLFAAHFTEGRNVGDVDELVNLGEELGLDADAVRTTIETDAYLDAVRADQREAAAIGISGVPFYVLDGRYGLSGAQPPAVFASALRRVAQERESDLAPVSHG